MPVLTLQLTHLTSFGLADEFKERAGRGFALLANIVSLGKPTRRVKRPETSDSEQYKYGRTRLQERVIKKNLDHSCDERVERNQSLFVRLANQKEIATPTS